MKEDISSKQFFFFIFGAERNLVKIIMSYEPSILIITTSLGLNLVFSRKPTILSSRRGIGNVWSRHPLYGCSPVFASSQDVRLNGKFFLGHPISAFLPHFYPRLYIRITDTRPSFAASAVRRNFGYGGGA